jgi:hypothetical protein
VQQLDASVGQRDDGYAHPPDVLEVVLVARLKVDGEQRPRRHFLGRALVGHVVGERAAQVLDKALGARGKEVLGARTGAGKFNVLVEHLVLARWQLEEIKSHNHKFRDLQNNFF